MQFHLSIALLLPAVLTAAQAVDRPANLGRPNDEHPSNLTIDQIIQGTIDPNAPLSMTGPDGLVLAELDMWLTRDQYMDMYPAEGDRSKRRATRDEKLRWTNKTLNYMYYPGHFSLYQQYWLRRAFTDWERYTCINFKPKEKSDVNWARFQNGNGCNSQLGMVGGMQPINLESPGCRWKGLYLHETGHAIGLIHEQQSPLRDDWIWIEWDNVKPEWKEWFKKRTTEEVNTYGVPYEYSSIMHYGITAFSKDGKSQTIHAKYPERESEIGIVYLKELAWTDAAIVNKMYHCAAHCPDQDKCGEDGVLNENCQCICKDGSHDTCDKTLTADPSCQNEDQSWRCYIWANQGECERNPKYMKKACKKACQVCGTPKPSPPSPCKNVFLDKKCEMWRKRGDCVTNRWWMQQNCAVACQLCTEPERKLQENCQNNYADLAKCTDWATSGECVINPDGMFKHCQMSCKACNNTGGHIGFGKTELAPLPKVNHDNDYKCIDQHDQCEEWAASGECDNNPKYMIFHCRKACGKCEDGTCKNIYSDKWCDSWANSGECQANPVNMARSCAQSCSVGLCKGKIPVVKCINNHDQCDEWAVTGECDNNPKYMIYNCRKACGKCEDGTCKNIYSDKMCDLWAIRGECQANPVNMERNCAQSCSTGLCKGKTTKAPPKITTTAEVPEVCSNKHDNDHDCEAWAQAGHCDTNPGYMKVMCKLACGVCTVAEVTHRPPTVCADESPECPTWAKEGHCDSDRAEEVLKKCRKSCDNCGCKDESRFCGPWAEHGGCASNPRYMVRHCQKACGVC